MQIIALDFQEFGDHARRGRFYEGCMEISSHHLKSVLKKKEQRRWNGMEWNSEWNGGREYRNGMDERERMNSGWMDME